MEKEITNQLKKAYIAIKTAYYSNELEPNSQLIRNKLIAIEEILKKLLGYK